MKTNQPNPTIVEDPPWKLPPKPAARRPGRPRSWAVSPFRRGHLAVSPRSVRSSARNAPLRARSNVGLVLATFVEGFTGFLHFLIGFRGKEWQRAMIFFQKWYLWTVLSHNKAVISWDLWRVAKCWCNETWWEFYFGKLVSITPTALDSWVCELILFGGAYPLVICYKAIENDHRNSGVSHENTAMLVITRG